MMLHVFRVTSVDLFGSIFVEFQSLVKAKGSNSSLSLITSNVRIRCSWFLYCRFFAPKMYQKCFPPVIRQRCNLSTQQHKHQTRESVMNSGNSVASRSFDSMMQVSRKKFLPSPLRLSLGGFRLA